MIIIYSSFSDRAPVDDGLNGINAVMYTNRKGPSLPRLARSAREVQQCELVCAYQAQYHRCPNLRSNAAVRDCAQKKRGSSTVALYFRVVCRFLPRHFIAHGKCGPNGWILGKRDISLLCNQDDVQAQDRPKSVSVDTYRCLGVRKCSEKEKEN